MNKLRCFAYSYPKSLDIKKLKEGYSRNHQVARFGELLHFKEPSEAPGQAEGDVFVFAYGVIVTWGFSREQERSICSKVGAYCQKEFGTVDDDHYTYVYGDSAAIADDHIVLPNQRMETKLACSYALAQSVKLGGFEEKVHRIWEQTKQYPEQMAESGTVGLSRQAMRKLMARIFLERASVNLHLNLLGTPDFFWDKPDLEPVYDMITGYVGQANRVAILNQQLNLLHDQFHMLANDLHNRHSEKLEWIIIALISIEAFSCLTREVPLWAYTAYRLAKWLVS
jgi:uncharacterized Rmd1/YagE family protein